MGSVGKYTGLAIRSAVEAGLHCCLQLQAGHPATLSHWAQSYIFTGLFWEVNILLNMKAPLWPSVWHITGTLEVFAKFKSVTIKPKEGFVPVLITDSRQILISSLGLRVVLHTQHCSLMLRRPINTCHVEVTEPFLTQNAAAWLMAYLSCLCSRLQAWWLKAT